MLVQNAYRDEVKSYLEFLYDISFFFLYSMPNDVSK
jgi:hypothetical protein